MAATLGVGPGTRGISSTLRTDVPPSRRRNWWRGAESLLLTQREGQGRCRCKGAWVGLRPGARWGAAAPVPGASLSVLGVRPHLLVHDPRPKPGAWTGDLARLWFFGQ